MPKNFSVLHNYAFLRHLNALPHLVSFIKVTFLTLCPQVPPITLFFFLINWKADFGQQQLSCQDLEPNFLSVAFIFLHVQKEHHY